MKEENLRSSARVEFRDRDWFSSLARFRDRNGTEPRDSAFQVRDKRLWETLILNNREQSILEGICRASVDSVFACVRPCGRSHNSAPALLGYISKYLSTKDPFLHPKLNMNRHLYNSCLHFKNPTLFLQKRVK